MTYDSHILPRRQASEGREGAGAIQYAPRKALRFSRREANWCSLALAKAQRNWRPNDLRKLAAYVVLIANAIAVKPPLLQWQSVLTESAVLPCEAACVDGAKPQPIETTVAKPRVHSKPSVDEAVD